MDFSGTTTLGRTGLTVGRLGVAASYGAPTKSIEQAYDLGCNYFYWATRRTSAMAQAIKNIVAQGRRDRLVVAMQSFSRSPLLMELFLAQGLKKAGLDYADVLIMGWHNKRPSPRLIDRADRLRRKGMVRFLGLSGHNRSLFPEIAKDDRFDVLQIRYNAAHRGAEDDIFPLLDPDDRPGVTTYTATRWGELLKPGKMPPDREPPPASSCYRFVLSHPLVDLCLIGPRNEDQMNQALETLTMGPLSEQERADMIALGDHVHKVGRKF